MTQTKLEIAGSARFFSSLLEFSHATLQLPRDLIWILIQREAHRLTDDDFHVADPGRARNGCDVLLSCRRVFLPEERTGRRQGMFIGGGGVLVLPTARCQTEMPACFRPLSSVPLETLKYSSRDPLDLRQMRNSSGSQTVAATEIH